MANCVVHALGSSVVLLSFFPFFYLFFLSFFLSVLIASSLYFSFCSVFLSLGLYRNNTMSSFKPTRFQKRYITKPSPDTVFFLFNRLHFEHNNRLTHLNYSPKSSLVDFNSGSER